MGVEISQQSDTVSISSVGSNLYQTQQQQHHHQQQQQPTNTYNNIFQVYTIY